MVPANALPSTPSIQHTGAMSSAVAGMRWDATSRTPAAAAWRHVDSLAGGPPVDPQLRVTLHFHPDRFFSGRPLLDHLAADGWYRSQFETRTSNGGLTAHVGGQRWEWESRIFGGAYDHGADSDRPKYSSLNHRRRREGGSIRFGSAHLRLAAHTLQRTTFCYPDSVFEPEAFGTAEHLALGALADADSRDRLDDYIEAHLHGPLRLDRDVEALVLDPAHRDSEVAEAAAALPFPLEWHHGFRLHVDELARHADYRGEEVLAAGLTVARTGWIDARLIGDAVHRGEHDEQTLKRLWHCVARFGGPREG